ncbi:hypothetical protein CHS0354_004446 [Potamilus streckersoni]|uniref:Ferritin n=1 Tax=Potamilus streckersoni TaxID=2493646 RepID=A0AAE0SPL3_9BIVA|nr:hypothetical protein CHS0354_004446 [Potamilus streckersoni]
MHGVDNLQYRLDVLITQVYYVLKQQVADLICAFQSQDIIQKRTETRLIIHIYYVLKQEVPILISASQFLYIITGAMKAFFALLLLGVCSAVDYVERIKQNFDDDVNVKISEQIRLELQASYIYLAYSQYFGRADVALPAFAKYFEDASKEEREHATYLMDYLNKRGGFLTLYDTEFDSVCQTIRAHKDMQTLTFRSNACDRTNWKNGLWAMQDALILERFVSSAIYELHALAGKLKDSHFEHVLEHHFLDEQIKSVQKISEHIRRLELVGDGLGEYLFSL